VLHWLKTWDPHSGGEVQSGKTQDPKFRRSKILLLSGSPGIGKTTLCHVLANQAGYNPVEINASDDRNLETFSNKLLGAVQTSASFLGKNIPNCLIIDEIDGIADSGTNVIQSILLIAMLQNPIDFLLKMIDEEHSAEKKKKPVVKLGRPIICICNNQ
jgi:chromosome transmission fidelity protein 18